MPYPFLFFSQSDYSILMPAQIRSTQCLPLRKHAYSNILKILPQKNVYFQIKKTDIFHISAQNIGGSNEYPHSMFLSWNKKNNLYPCKPQFYYIKMGFKGSKLYRRVFVMLKTMFITIFVLDYNDRVHMQSCRKYWTSALVLTGVCSDSF